MIFSANSLILLFFPYRPNKPWPLVPYWLLRPNIEGYLGRISAYNRKSQVLRHTGKWFSELHWSSDVPPNNDRCQFRYCCLVAAWRHEVSHPVVCGRPVENDFDNRKLHRKERSYRFRICGNWWLYSVLTLQARPLFVVKHFLVSNMLRTTSPANTVIRARRILRSQEGFWFRDSWPKPFSHELLRPWPNVLLPEWHSAQIPPYDCKTNPLSIDSQSFDI